MTYIQRMQLRAGAMDEKRQRRKVARPTTHTEQWPSQDHRPAPVGNRYYLRCTTVDRCHIKMSPSRKIRPEKNNHGFDMSPLIKYCRSHKSLYITGSPSPPPEKFPPADNLPVKSVPPGAPGGADFSQWIVGRGRFFFWGGDDPITGHWHQIKSTNDDWAD